MKPKTKEKKFVVPVDSYLLKKLKELEERTKRLEEQPVWVRPYYVPPVCTRPHTGEWTAPWRPQFWWSTTTGNAISDYNGFNVPVVDKT